jgi:hypothetical protein
MNLVWSVILNCQFENTFPAYLHIEITQQNFHTLSMKLIKHTS